MTPLSTVEAEALLNQDSEVDFHALLARAGEVRRRHSGNRVSACSIINARCGNCPEDCSFCAQSRRSSATIEKYPLVDEETMIRASAQAALDGASHFSVVTSGRAVNAERDLAAIAGAIGRIAEGGAIRPCASLGTLDESALRRLRNAGMTRYHHNLETARSFFPNICTTKDYDDKLRTVAAAKAVGLEVCCGGIFGLGESRAQRVEMLATIRDLDIDSVPINFLVPIPGTPLERQADLSPRECLKIIAVARLMMPGTSIRLCGGREPNLRDLQSWIFAAGADALMIGGYLVTGGRPVDLDRCMIADAGMELASGQRSSSCHM
jgi:biotin synthase